MKYGTILLSKDNGLAVLTLNRPETMNALNSLMVEELRHALADIDRNGEIRVVVLTGGERCFAAGVDIREIEAIGAPVP